MAVTRRPRLCRWPLSHIDGFYHLNNVVVFFSFLLFENQTTLDFSALSRMRLHGTIAPL